MKNNRMGDNYPAYPTHQKAAAAYSETEAVAKMMYSCELTAVITALANTVGCRLSVEELTLLAAACNQLGDTLATIAAQRSICEKDAEHMS